MHTEKNKIEKELEIELIKTLKENVYLLQQQLQTAYIRIKELGEKNG
jgi:hypothetical protein|tara:strand:- start:390 stop:530 length:141 start_codon:yes stop_codon:yes gene_type:complete